MDFWDLTRLLFRRWYVTVPMLLLTGYGAYWAATEVQPDYNATAYVQLIPPTAPETKPGQPAPEVRNAWLDLGLGSLNTAAAKSTSDRRFMLQLEASGLSDKVTITEGYPSPMVTIEVVGNSEEQASATASAVSQRFTDVVTQLQKDRNVVDSQMIEAQRLDQGDNLEVAGGKVKRAVVALVAAGLLMTGAFAIAFDAIARRRPRKPEEGAGVPTPRVAAATRGAPGESTEVVNVRTRVRPQPSLAGTVTSAEPPRGPANGAVNGGGRPAVNGPPVVVPGAAVPANRGPANGKTGSANGAEEDVQPISVEYRPTKADQQVEGTAERPRAADDTILLSIGRIERAREEEPDPEPSDATIVLPMPAQWMAKRKRQ